MNNKVREPFFIPRFINLCLGIIILGFLIVVLVKDSDTEIYEVLLFGFAAVENFIGATISFSEKKRVRGNIYAVVSAVFFVVALVMAIGYFVFV